MRKITKIFFLSVFLIIITFPSLAADIVNQISPPRIDAGLSNVITGFIGIIQIIGTMVAVAASVWLGIRYVTSSVEEKAEIKKKLIPFVIGVIIFYGATGIIQIIAEMASWIKY